MCFSERQNNSCCCLITIIGSLLAAAGIAAIFFSGLIISIQTLIYITLILGILLLIYILIAVFCCRRCHVDLCLVAASVGSIVTSVFALTATSLAILTITTAILVGAIAFFLMIDLIYIVCALVSMNSSSDNN